MKDLDLDDPMQPTGEALFGDPELMLTCMVEEFAALGHSEAELLEMFADPFFQAATLLREKFGADGVADRVSRVIERCGVISVKTYVTPDEPGGISEIPDEITLTQVKNTASRDGRNCE